MRPAPPSPDDDGYVDVIGRPLPAVLRLLTNAVIDAGGKIHDEPCRPAPIPDLDTPEVLRAHDIDGLSFSCGCGSQARYEMPYFDDASGELRHALMCGICDASYLQPRTLVRSE